MVGELKLIERNVKILIIGIGNIGKRHVEAILNLKYKVSLYLVDTLIDSPNNQEFFKKIDTQSNIDIFTFDNLNNIREEKFDIGIIATNSIQRLGILKETLNNFKIQYLILEKFLFPYINEYQEAFDYINKSQTKVYVNCGRREWESYKQLNEIFKYEKNIQIKVIGGNWNLPSNLIHFVDLFNYFTNFNEVTLNIDEESIEIIESKRNGYINFLGVINAMDNKGNTLSLSSKKGLANGINKITITSENYLCFIQEQMGICHINDQVSTFKLEKVSELTNKTIESLIETGECNLTDYNKSMEFHIGILNEFQKIEKIRQGVIT